jgi:hypothetical protein
MLLRTVSLLMGLDMVWYGRTTCKYQKEEADVREKKIRCEEEERERSLLLYSESRVYLLFLELL